MDSLLELCHDSRFNEVVMVSGRFLRKLMSMWHLGGSLCTPFMVFRVDSKYVGVKYLVSFSCFPTSTI